jgi:hypothetical protein
MHSCVRAGGISGNRCAALRWPAELGAAASTSIVSCRPRAAAQADRQDLVQLQAQFNLDHQTSPVPDRVVR